MNNRNVDESHFLSLLAIRFGFFWSYAMRRESATITSTPRVGSHNVSGIVTRAEEPTLKICPGLQNVLFYQMSLHQGLMKKLDMYIYISTTYTAHCHKSLQYDALGCKGSIVCGMALN